MGSPDFIIPENLLQHWGMPDFELLDCIKKGWLQITDLASPLILSLNKIRVLEAINHDNPDCTALHYPVLIYQLIKVGE
ncbi:hypothetical protein SAMN04489760_1019 [Syntrophus gentianae]|uniref:Uncharacterized protein n=1 Tax=Syntrophus gentianae TaxID=43775 RepID=A0A1H7U7J7_9BACT|nr:hypothetical protein SAMN04489760_1019 [Syntrophus gentianae]